ncbi:hypothetical protein A2954_03420 [Candidatus Roizmanbacteria bacterium RIFCSPLOWO2_01_FULL_37_12]|uniref:Uncharacterized protein n=1 Tax=Candidatus Roizmanbacteria bacterium RIFCSPLOWO2_01_FULL_37_12 TaxID=1802056 RepID=A0A1F7IFD4_9BACT|nr:MAG: hypothetical protein A2768_01890 [Candidatus Roizmanbacteria bacterium RIFCSPHIGHO2_01_FULL_37_16]OGK25320.1 MAG: hypothetical protein A3D76_00815 [Candidatus Roizmanbacteria bacterium RIFCSPHIGHO2_02_FULL_37_9b]OGK42076.1 MAG: hypothetical protein A2954_03420 [Candidatus Roizmanbacteria bacterium RIFCSPLOWO2_01_FULL_37_12]
MKKLFLIVLFIASIVYIVYKFIILPSQEKKTSAQTNNNQVQETVYESAGSLILGFPDIPVYSNLVVDKSFKKELNGKTNYVATWFFEGDNKEIMKWYADEFVKTGWTVVGPFIYESENKLEIDAENSMYKLRLLNTEREEGDTGKPGELIMVEIIQK